MCWHELCTSAHRRGGEVVAAAADEGQQHRLRRLAAGALHEAVRLQVPRRRPLAGVLQRGDFFKKLNVKIPRGESQRGFK